MGRWNLDFSVGNEEGLTLYILLTRKSSKSEAFQCSRRSVVDLTTKCLALRAKRYASLRSNSLRYITISSMVSTGMLCSLPKATISGAFAIVPSGLVTSHSTPAD